MSSHLLSVEIFGEGTWNGNKFTASDLNEIVDLIRNIDSWEFSKYEGFYNPKNYESDILDKVKTFSVVNSLVSRINNEFEYYNQESESYVITKELFNENIYIFNLNFMTKQEYITLINNASTTFSISSLISSKPMIFQCFTDSK